MLRTTSVYGFPRRALYTVLRDDQVNALWRAKLWALFWMRFVCRVSKALFLVWHSAIFAEGNALIEAPAAPIRKDMIRIQLHTPTPKNLVILPRLSKAQYFEEWLESADTKSSPSSLEEGPEQTSLPLPLQEMLVTRTPFVSRRDQLRDWLNNLEPHELIFDPLDGRTKLSTEHWADDDEFLDGFEGIANRNWFGRAYHSGSNSVLDDGSMQPPSVDEDA